MQIGDLLFGTGSTVLKAATTAAIACGGNTASVATFIDSSAIAPFVEKFSNSAPFPIASTFELTSLIEGQVPRSSGGETLRDQRLQSELAKYRSLADGWDGPGSFATKGSTLQDLQSFLSALVPGTPLPRAMFSPSGEAGLYWDERDYFIDAEFHGDGTVSLCGQSKVGAGSELYFESLSARDSANWLSRAVGELTAL